MKGILVSTKNEKMQVVNVENKLEAFYEVLDCDTIDITARKIAGMYVEIVCDDEGIIPQAMPTAYGKEEITIKETCEGEAELHKSLPAVLCGNLLIFGGVDADGDLYGLNDDQVEYLLKQGVVIQDIWTKTQFEGIKNVEFI